MTIGPYRPKISNVSNERAYELLRRPIVTEKSTAGSNFGQVTFEVPVKSAKPEIKQAVESLFNVEVSAINTLLIKGKMKRYRGRLGRRSNYKKAIVILARGHNIDLMLGI
ncbi:Ribosomal protein L23 [Candidatus Endolissoclinum faulkneri L2]|uniref:Large ribosomal subunit protein uL23 n=1 Tax=Candidatus Endolissoclinum faulkneri L2 TaxID=1193729 RepID=K7ZCC3_9PROT|nr:50S ribosomal protein L23 [Candidatus Endolissoclinum faulkneri]AFX98436.1 Ribosomal protein L23 [Candidatus Endolissoclinum faulkneri L2]